MDCEICANCNKLSSCLQKGRELERQYNGLCAVTKSTHIISQRFGVRIQGQGQLNPAL